MGKIFTPANASNPMTTSGDIIVGGVNGTASRLGVGANGQLATADSTATNGISYQNQFNDYNFIVNSGFDYFQEATTKTVTATGGGTPTASYAYGADQWYVNNILGGGTVEGVITMTKQPSSLAGSGNTFRSLITTAPTGTGIQNGLEVYQPLSAAASIPLLGQTASFSIQVLAIGNITQVGLQFYSAISESKITTAIGSETLFTVNSSTFTLCAINGQALGVGFAGGIVGIRIRPTAVSSGNLYSLNNGLDLEQAMLNLGPVAHPWHRQNTNPALELAACQYFYQKTFNTTVAPVQNSGTTVGAFQAVGQVTNVGIVAIWNFKVTMRATPSITTYSTNAASANWSTNGNTPTASVVNTGQSGAVINGGTAVTSGAGYSVHATADARI